MNAVQAIAHLASSSVSLILERLLHAQKSEAPRRFGRALALGVATLSLAAPASATVAPATLPAAMPGANWVQLSPGNSPPVRYSSSMAYDAAHGTVVLFGGSASSSDLNDTWLWDGATWTNVTPANTSASYPSARSLANMVYDAATGNVVMFGGIVTGQSGYTYLNDTWVWNGTSWTQVSPATSPSARGGHMMSYDPATGTVFLFGGCADFSSADGYLNDSWSWNGSTWTMLRPNDAASTHDPARRTIGGMSFNSSTGTTVLFGGTNGDGSLLSDTWVWNGSGWMQQSPSTSPSARSGPAMVYDPAIGATVLFGGVQLGGGSFVNDTWSWNGSNWTQLQPATSPSVRWIPTAAFDVASNSVLLFGGIQQSGRLNDSWSYVAGAFVAPAAKVAAAQAAATTQTQLSGNSAVTPNIGAGTQSTTFPVYFTVTTSGNFDTLSNANVLTAGVSGKDFTLGTGSTCSGALTAGTNCVVNVVFTPVAPGSRLGAVNLTSGGAVVATAFISGTGQGPLVTFTPGALSTVAGNGTLCASQTGPCGNNGPATSASIVPQGTLVDPAGNIYIADSYDNRIWKIAAGTMTIVGFAGTGATCTSTTDPCGDGGPAAAAQFTGPGGLAIDGAGNLYIADSNANRIRKVNAATGVISTVAGTGQACTSPSTGCGDGGSAASATLHFPYDIAVDGVGNLYIADASDLRVRMVSAATANITTVAGTGTDCASTTDTCGDGGAATSANVTPEGIALASNGDLYIADTLHHRIRKVTASSGAISTVAGTGTACSSPSATCGDGGQATAANLNQPLVVKLDPAGNIFVADTLDNRVRKITASTGVISTITGTGTVCSAATAACGDGNAATASGSNLNHPSYVSLDDAGNLYVSDQFDYRLREDTATAAPLTFLSAAPNSTSSDSPQTVIVSNTGNSVLTLSAPGGTANNPSVTQGFTLASGGTACPLATGAATATIAAGASCTEAISFTPQTNQAGNGVSGSVMFTDDATPSPTQSIGLSGVAQSSTQPPTIGAFFAPPSANVNSNSTLTFTLTNPTTNPGASTNIAFTDDLPTGLVISTPNGANNGCGGTFTATAGGTHIALSGASIATPGNACTITVSVTPTTAATSYSTTTSAVSSDQGNGTTGATATLSIPQPTIASISPSTGYTIGGNTVTISGTNFIAGTTVTFGGTAGTNVMVANDGNSLTVVTPAHAAGGVNVVVTTPNGSVTSTGGFTYQSGALSPGSLPDGTYGTAYSQSVSPTVALFPPYTFTVSAGLPTGLALNAGPAANSATISGTPTAAGNYSFTITTRDGFGFSYNTNYTLNIKTAPLSVAVDSKMFTYGGTYPTLTGTPTGLTNGDTASGIGLMYATTTPTTNMSAAGTYTISATITSTNYALTVTTGTLTINKATPVLTAPTASGITYGQTLASSILSNGTATDLNSGATVTGSFAWTAPSTTPNAGTPSYSVTFTPDAANSGNYTFATTTSSVAVAKAVPTLTAPTASAINYGQTLASSNFTGGSAKNPYNNSALTGTFTWTDSTIAPTPGQQTYSVTFTPDAANSANYLGNTIQVTLTVNPATLTLVAPSASTINYGQLLSTSTFTGGSATNPNNNAAVAGTFTWTNGSQTPPAGNDTFGVTFTPTTNPSYYNVATTTATLTVTKALPTISVAPSASTITYGQALSASAFSGGTVVNPNSGASVSGTYTWADSTIKPTAGQHTYTVTFTATGADTNNYLTNTVQVTITVQKADPTLSRQPTASAIVYGAALSTSTLSGGAYSVPGVFAWTNGTTVPPAGTAAYPVTFTPTDTNNYNAESTNVSITVAKATPSITTAPTASSIVYGQPLSASTLSGGVGSPAGGTFSWTNGSTVPPAGSTASYSVTYTPTDTNNYNPNTINVVLVVNKATPTVTTPPTASAITYGQTLANSTLSGGSASVAGKFAWTDSTIAPSGGTTSYSVTFTPTDTADYNTTTAQVSVVTNQASQTLTFTQPTSPATYGDAPLALNASATSGLAPTFSIVSGPGTITGGNMLTITGAGSIVVAADQAGNGNYSAATRVTRTVTVNMAAQTITFTQPASPIAYSANATVALTATGGSSSNAVTFSVLSGPGTISGSTLTITGAGTIIVAADQTGNSNYNAATEVQRSIVVTMASQTITFTQPATVVYGSASTVALSATGGASGNPVTFAVVSGPGTISGSTLTITSAGSIVVAADQTGTANYNAAPEVQRTVVIAKASATLTGPAAQPVVVGTNQAAMIPVSIAGQYSGSTIAVPSGAINYAIVSAASTTVASGSLTISNGSVVVPVPSTLAGGQYSISVTYAGDVNYATSTITVALMVSQLQPMIVWAQPAAVVYGTSLANVLTASAQDQSTSPAKTVPGTYVYTEGSTVITTSSVLAVGTHTLTVTFTPNDTSAYKTATGSVTLVVNKTTASVTVGASALTAFLQNPVVLTATVSSAASTPTGTVTFLDGTTTLGTGTLVNGSASLTASTLAAGSHAITVQYGGDTNFAAQTSSIVTVQIADFTIAVASGGNSSLSIPRGSSASFNLTLSPTGASSFPSAVAVTLTGLPAGATYTIAPQTVLAGSGSTNITVTVNIPAQTSMLQRLSPLTLALLLLPFSGRIRRRAGKVSRLAAMMLVLVGCLAGAATLTGCATGSSSGSGSSGPQTSNVVITGTSGTLSHSTTVTITAQ